MKEYQASKVRNVSIIGSAGAGKTILAESFLLAGGIIDRKGTIENKNTVSDYRPIEHERENSIKSTVLYSEFNGHKINMIDNPGFDDFVGEVIASMHVTEVSLLVLNGNGGMDVGSEISWRNAANYNQPVILLANQMDHEKTDYDELLKASRELFGKKVVPIQYPVATGAAFEEIVDVLKMKMYKYPKGGGKPEVLEIPDDQMGKAEELHNNLVEAAAENDDQLMELFFDKGTLDEDEMRKGITIGLMKRELFPMMCVSGKENIGIYRALEFITKVVPAPIEYGCLVNENDEEIKFEEGKPASIFVFKTSFEEHLGEVSYFKVVTGKITEAIDLENLNTSTKEKLSQLYVMAGKKRDKISSLEAGDIGATIKLKNTKTDHTLAAKGIDYKYAPIAFPQPKFRTAIKAANSADDEKLASALIRMNVEDSTLIFEYSKELKQMILSGQGELHINIAKWHLEKEYKVDAELIAPKIPYRETITKEAKAMYRHKKQSGGAGQFGEVHLMIEPYEEGKPDPDPNIYNIRGKEEIPLNWGGMLVYYNAIVGGAIDTRFLPAILKGIMERIETGPLTGSYARDIRVTVYDGKMHPVDSNEISFKLAGRNAFAQAFKNAGPKLMEPICLVEVILPEEKMGDVMTDLQGRRALILGMEGMGIYQKIKANIPLAEMNKYSTALSSLTNGRASYTMEIIGYEQVPSDIQDKLLKEYEASQSEED